jgi:hypothetical protein
MSENEKKTLTEEELKQAAGGSLAGDKCYYVKAEPYAERDDAKLSTGWGLKCHSDCFARRSFDGGWSFVH